MAGWGLVPASIASLPTDVICGPISQYSDGCVSGKEYGKREFWGCPWLERDFGSSEYYYPYNMHLCEHRKGVARPGPEHERASIASPGG